MKKFVAFSAASAVTAVTAITIVSYESPTVKKQLLKLNYPAKVLQYQFDAYEKVKLGFYSLASLKTPVKAQPSQRNSLAKSEPKPPLEVQHSNPTPPMEPSQAKMEHINHDISSWKDVEKFVSNLVSSEDGKYVKEHLHKIQVWLSKEAEPLKKELDHLRTVAASTDVSDLKAELQKEFDQGMSEMKARLQRRNDQERKDLDTFYKEVIRLRLADQEELLRQKYQAEVKQQVLQIEQHFQSRARKMIDTERQGRLAKLDVLERKMKDLEVTSDGYVKAFDQSQQTLRDIVAFDKLQLVLNQGKSAVPVIKGQGKDEFSQVLGRKVIKNFQRYGSPNEYDLQQRFNVVLRDARRFQYAKVDQGAPGLALSFLLSLVTFSKSSFPTSELGQDVESVLVQAERALYDKDYVSMYAFLSKLQEWPGEVSQEYSVKVKNAAELQLYLEAIEAHKALKVALIH